MKKKNFLFISCEEAQIICDKCQYGEATFWERLQLKVRLCYCNMTKSYTRNNKKLTKLCDEAHLSVMETCDKEKMKKELENKLSE